MIRAYLQSPGLQRALTDGIVAAVDAKRLAWIVGSLALALMIITYPMSFLGRCVFVDSLPDSDEAFCSALPPLPWWAWILLAAVFFLVSLAYVLTHRWCVEYGFVLPAGRTWINPSAAVAFVGGLGIGLVWAKMMAADEGLTSFGRVVIVLSGPISTSLWHAHLILWARYLAARVLTHAEAVASLARIHLQRTVGLRSPHEMTVTYAPGRIHVTGPIDAVNARRMEDIVATQFPERLTASVTSTLPEDEYWALFHSELGPSGRAKDEIPEPAGIPVRAIQALAILFCVLFILALRGGGLQIGLDPEDIASFYGRLGLLPDEMPEAAGEESPDQDEPKYADWFYAVLAEAGADSLIPDPPFPIAVAESLDTCFLLAYPPQQVFRMETEGLLGPYINPHDPADRTRYGDIVVRIHRYPPNPAEQLWSVTFALFVIERRTGKCIDQQIFTGLPTAQAYGHNVPGVVPGRWQVVPLNLDWRYVPPRPPTVTVDG